MKIKNKNPNYYPIQFALNRAVFHKEITEAEADRGIAEHVALVAVAETAKVFGFCDATDKREPCNETTCRSCNLRKALAQLTEIHQQSSTAS